MCYGQHISIYIDFGGLLEDITWVSLHYSFSIHKTVKMTRTWPILKSNSTSFLSASCFPRAIYKIFTKTGDLVPHSNFLGTKCIYWYENKTPNSSPLFGGLEWHWYHYYSKLTPFITIFVPPWKIIFLARKMHLLPQFSTYGAEPNRIFYRN